MEKGRNGWIGHLHERERFKVKATNSANGTYKVLGGRDLLLDPSVRRKDLGIHTGFFLSNSVKKIHFDAPNSLRKRQHRQKPLIPTSPSSVELNSVRIFCSVSFINLIEN